jgi:GMP synthase PP-ATPase subunit
MKLIGEEKKVKRIVKEILDVFSKTSLDIESNREIVADTIARDIVNNTQVKKLKN